MISYPKELDGEIKKIELKKIGGNFRSVFNEFMTSAKNPQVIKAVVNLSIYSGYYKTLKVESHPPVQKIFTILLFPI